MVPNFPHWHTCEACLHSWKHKPPAVEASDQEIRDYHMCPACGEGPWADADRYKYEATARAKQLAKLSPEERSYKQRVCSLMQMLASLNLGDDR